jgi:riboflavin kinase/FMN adenylyltransferase
MNQTPDIIPTHWKSVQREKSSFVTMGNFDGVHKGHVALLHILKEEAARLEVEPLVVTFLPHPKVFFQKKQNDTIQTAISPSLLSTSGEKKKWIEQEGVSILFVEFDESFANLEPQEFIQKFLKERLLAKGCMLGPNHLFGKGAKGDHPMLEQAFGKKHAIAIPPLDTVIAGENVRVSSSIIRKHLAQGKVRDAQNMLGRAYSYTGTIVSGDNRGRQLGFPTANISLDNTDKLLVPSGVYGMEVYLENGDVHRAVANIGKRPTFYSQTSEVSKRDSLDTASSIEVHLLDFVGDLYGQRIEIHFRQFLRIEKKFNSGEELAEQIKRDIAVFTSNERVEN